MSPSTTWPHTPADLATFSRFSTRCKVLPHSKSKNLINTVDIRNSFYTDAQIQAMQATLAHQRQLETEASAQGKNVMLSESEIGKLRQLQTIVNASIHPDTNKPVPWVMRMCAFVPTNLPIIFGMLMTPPTPMNTVFWQWINQTYNAGMNYGNRNASSQQTTGDILFGYSAAVASSITISLGLRKLSAGLTKNMKGGTMILANSIINYIAVASAGFLNSYCMRMGEMSRGIKIQDEHGEEMGISKKSAEKAVIQTSFSRMVLSGPIFILPGLSMFLLDKVGLIPRARIPKTILELTVISLALWVALPLSVSLFPPRGEIEASEIESEFREMRNSKGELVTRYYYNKGL